MIKYICYECGAFCGENLIKTSLISFEICNFESCVKKVILLTEKGFLIDKKYMIKIMKDERDYVCFVQARKMWDSEHTIDKTIIGFSSFDNLWLLKNQNKQKEYIDYEMVSFIYNDDEFIINDKKKKIIRIFNETNIMDYENLIGKVNKYEVFNL